MPDSVNGQKKYLTQYEVLDILQVSRMTLYRLIKVGKLKGFKVGKQLRFDPVDIEQYVEGEKGKQEKILANRTAVLPPVPTPDKEPSPEECERVLARWLAHPRLAARIHMFMAQRGGIGKQV